MKTNYLRRPGVLVLIVMFAATVAVRADKVDDYVRAAMQKQHVPGVAVAVVRDGKVIKAAGYGMANLELNVAATPDTVFKIGSVSKQFLSAGIMLLVQDGKLSLDDKISKFLDGTPDTWKDITVRHLLTHTSGLVREAPGFNPLKIQSDADVIKTAYGVPLVFKTGDKWQYCNVGYFSLAEIIHKVSGKPWGDFLTERIFAPLGMNSTRTTTMTDLVQNRANGYAWSKGKYQNADIYFALRPSGAFLSTVNDLAKWDAALYTDKFLTKATRDQMWTPVKLNNGETYPYGFGWQLEPAGNHRQVRHGGSLPGFRAEFTRLVDDKLSVIVLTNGDGANAASIAAVSRIIMFRTCCPIGRWQRSISKYLMHLSDSISPIRRTDFIVVVTREGRKLMVQEGSDAEKQELLPESETDYFMDDEPLLTYTFIKGENGLVAELAVMRGKQQLAKAKKDQVGMSAEKV